MKTHVNTVFVALVYIFLGIIPVLSQDKIKFGNVPREMVEMKYYDKDSTAEAVILGDYGSTSFSYDKLSGRFILNFNKHTIIKIFNSNAYDWADVEILLYDD
ncbi:MAG: hypothetical protein OEY51_08520, partial [Cyclobacteriaceae bacterium]|nr:hypothetical protein [Cyclobacteriaceae bacterium]